METESLGIGQEIRRIRKWRGMTQEALAGQAGLTKGYLSKIENGLVALDRRSTLMKIAAALRVSLADLGGEHFLQDSADSVGSEALGSVPDIRFALLATSLDEPTGPSERPIQELAAETDRLAELRQDCRYTEVGKRLPALLTDLHAVAAGGGPAGCPAQHRAGRTGNDSVRQEPGSGGSRVGGRRTWP